MAQLGRLGRWWLVAWAGVAAGCVTAPARTIPDPLPEVLEWALPLRADTAHVGLVLEENASGSLEDLSFGAGLRVAAVEPNSPAAAAGFAAGDVVLAVAGREVFAPQDVTALVASAGAGGTLPFEVQRGDTVFEVPLVVAAAAQTGAPSRPLFHLDPARTRAAFGDADGASGGGAVVVARADDGPLGDVPVGARVQALDGAAVLSGRGLVRALLARAPGDEVVLGGVDAQGAARTWEVELLDQGRVLTRASLPILFTFDQDLEADRSSFVLIDLWIVSLLRRERDGNETRWRVLRFIEWSTGVGELGE